MDLDANALLASLAFSTVGLGCFIYGKKQLRFPWLVGGLLLMVYPYFISNVWLIVVVGFVLVGAMVLAQKLGL